MRDMSRQRGLGYMGRLGLEAIGGRDVAEGLRAAREGRRPVLACQIGTGSTATKVGIGASGLAIADSLRHSTITRCMFNVVHRAMANELTRRHEATKK